MRALSKAFVATLLGACFFALITFFWPAANLWGAPEKPRQCESLVPEAASPGARRAMRLYREGILARTLREPRNTWSNLGFLFVGAYLIAAAGTRGFDHWMGGVLIYQFVASSLYHASLMPLFRDFDMMGVFAIAGLLCAMAVGKSFPQFALRPTAVWCIGIILIAATLAFLRQRLRWGEFAPLDTMLVLPVAGCLLVVAVLYSRVKGRDPRNIGIAALVTFGIGLAAGGLDRVGECLCAPGAPIQGHSVWHLCAAAAALLFCRWNAWDDLMEGRASALPRYRPASQR